MRPDQGAFDALWAYRGLGRDALHKITLAWPTHPGEYISTESYLSALQADMALYVGVAGERTQTSSCDGGRAPRLEHAWDCSERRRM